MKTRKATSLGFLILLIAMFVAASGCGGGVSSPLAPPPPPPPPSVSVAVSPTDDTLGPTSQRQFAATVTGANPDVSWKVEEGAAGGTVTTDGLYIAPSSTGTFHVIATSVADSTRSATATVSVVRSGFTAAGSMESTFNSATLLASGKVLVVGLADGSGVSAELFDPVTGGFTPTAGGMVHPHRAPYAVLLGNGKVLLAGGSDSNDVAFTSSELFDPATGSFTSTGDMTAPRSGATATLLQNGKVLIAGGTDNNATLLATAELYDPTTGTFTATLGNMTSVRWAHAANLLANGKVLLTGGRVNFAPNTNSATAELFDPSTSTFMVTGSMVTGRDFHSATLLANGQVLVLGGTSPGNHFSVSSGELYDPTTASFTSAGSLSAQRDSHSATLLPSGKVLVAGGSWSFFDDDGLPEHIALWSAELFDPSTGSSTFTGSLETQRGLHTATLLMDGRVLVISNGSAELYK